MFAEDPRVMWNPSPPPPEDWEEEAAREWEYVGIVNEEIDVYMTKRYEVKWHDWHRKDTAGTNTTWQRSSSDLADEQENWDNKRVKDRAAKVEKCLDIKICVDHDQPWHEDATIDMEVAYKDKIAERMRLGLRDYTHWQNIKHIDESDSNGNSNHGSQFNSHDSSVRRYQHGELQAAWSHAIKDANAAPIHIIPGPDTQTIPPGLEGFEYCEQNYIRDDGIPYPDPTYLVGCGCHAGCRSAPRCDCQDASELVNKAGDRVYAYNHDRTYRFNVPPNIEVVECNEVCTCGVNCHNRVAQRPRDVPMEIFYTGNCGWGVRATIDLPIGKVVGVYTGKLISREDANDLTDEHRAFIFDLDIHEMSNEDDDNMEQYSVDSFRHGNWSRFINHSCEPNTQVYPVVWDTVPQFNQPYLAFVTKKRIAAYTELTLDYNPQARTQMPGNSKGKSRIPEGAKPCMCGTERCRRWVVV